MQLEDLFAARKGDKFVIITKWSGDFQTTTEIPQGCDLKTFIEGIDDIACILNDKRDQETMNDENAQT